MFYGYLVGYPVAIRMRVQPCRCHLSNFKLRRVCAWLCNNHTLPPYYALVKYVKIEYDTPSQSVLPRHRCNNILNNAERAWRNWEVYLLTNVLQRAIICIVYDTYIGVYRIQTSKWISKYYRRYYIHHPDNYTWSIGMKLVRATCCVDAWYVVHCSSSSRLLLITNCIRVSTGVVLLLDDNHEY
jgi:hypothetical protein